MKNYNYIKLCYKARKLVRRIYDNYTYILSVNHLTNDKVQIIYKYEQGDVYDIIVNISDL